ncbi:MAG: hypothetical protein ACP5SH_27185 [Syntrophobacteraceae bacterium]
MEGHEITDCEYFRKENKRYAETIAEATNTLAVTIKLVSLLAFGLWALVVSAWVIIGTAVLDLGAELPCAGEGLQYGFPDLCSPLKRHVWLFSIVLVSGFLIVLKVSGVRYFKGLVSCVSRRLG